MVDTILAHTYPSFFINFDRVARRYIIYINLFTDVQWILLLVVALTRENCFIVTVYRRLPQCEIYNQYWKHLSELVILNNFFEYGKKLADASNGYRKHVSCSSSYVEYTGIRYLMKKINKKHFKKNPGTKQKRYGLMWKQYVPTYVSCVL